MELGMVGLGKMGANMTMRLLRGGHKMHVYDVNEDAVQGLVSSGALRSRSLADMAENLQTPRTIWLMVPAGEITEKTLSELSLLLSAGDVIIDGGNSYYKDSQRRAESLAEKGIHFIDAGTSGGVWGLEEGYSLMLGGEADVVERLRPVFETLAPVADMGWGHVGKAGAGHFVKMIHNGIEYGLMQAYAEGFELMKHKQEYDLDLTQVAEIWRQGSVVRSWLLDLIAKALGKNPHLDGIAAYVPDSGEGRWMVMEAIDLNCSIPVITAALGRRFRSREAAPFSDKLLAALRNEFGGHALKSDLT